MPICPRRLMDRPGGHGPSDARSTRAGDAVTVADMVMQRIVVPPYAGSNPVSHLSIMVKRKEVKGGLRALPNKSAFCNVRQNAYLAITERKVGL